MEQSSLNNLRHIVSLLQWRYQSTSSMSLFDLVSLLQWRYQSTSSMSLFDPVSLLQWRRQSRPLQWACSTQWACFNGVHLSEPATMAFSSQHTFLPSIHIYNGTEHLRDWNYELWPEPAISCECQSIACEYGRSLHKSWALRVWHNCIGSERDMKHWCEWLEEKRVNILQSGVEVVDFTHLHWFYSILNLLLRLSCCRCSCLCRVSCLLCLSCLGCSCLPPLPIPQQAVIGLNSGVWLTVGRTS